MERVFHGRSLVVLGRIAVLAAMLAAPLARADESKDEAKRHFEAGL